MTDQTPEPEQIESLALVPVPAVEVAGLFNPELKEGLNLNDRRLISMLLLSNDRVDVTIPDSISNADLWSSFELCCRVFVRARQAATQIKFLIGRALVLIQTTRPEIFENLGFRSFDDFMSDGARGLPFLTGISRSELYKAKLVAEKMSGVSLEDTRKLGYTKMALLAGFTTDKNSNFEEWKSQAEALTIPQLKIAIAEKGIAIEKGDLDDAILSLKMTAREKKRTADFLDDPVVHAVTGTERPGGILDFMIAECDAEWRSQGPPAGGPMEEIEG